MRIGFYYHCLSHDLTNFSFLRHIKFDGFIVSMHQSGSHWLKHMLATAISHELDLPPPKYNHASDIIGGPKDPVIYSKAPLLAHSHSIPNPMIRSKLIRKCIKFPRYVVLVRDIRACLAASYERWKSIYNCEFSEYLRGNPGGNALPEGEVWWCIRFKNSWGKTIEKFPDQTIVIKYEDITSDAMSQLKKIDKFLNLGISENSLVYGINESSKEKMKNKNDPLKKEDGTVVRTDKESYKNIFSGKDEETFRRICRDYLRHDFGYDYS